MNKIAIVPKTEKGKNAIAIHMKESLTLGWKQKAIFKTLGYKQSMQGDNFVLDITNQRIRSIVTPEQFKKILNEAMEKNGAKEDEDYIFEVN